MTDRTVRIGLVGVGGHGHRIQAAAERCAAVDVAAVYDPNRAEAQTAAARFGADAAATFEDLLGHPGLEAVVLATPNPIHRAQAEAAFGAGLDVLVEKPIANTVADGRAMIDAAARAGRILMVGHNVRRGRAARLAKRWIDEGRLGEIVTAEIHYSADNIQKRSHEGWRFEPGQAPLLPMLQLGLHAIDLVHFLLGPFRSVLAHTRSVLAPHGIVDTVVGTFELANGLAGTAVSTYCTPDLFSVRLAGTEGVATVDWIPHALTFAPRGSRTAAPERHDFEAYDLEDQVLQLEAFAHSVRTRAMPETDGHAGLHALAVVEAMKQSAEAHSPVEVGHVPER